MSHILCLSVFLGLVYFRDLKWDFSAEVVIIIIICFIVGIFASVETTFPLWTCFVAYVLYPIAPFLVYILHHLLNT